MRELSLIKSKAAAQTQAAQTQIRTPEGGCFQEGVLLSRPEKGWFRAPDPRCKLVPQSEIWASVPKNDVEALESVLVLERRDNANRCACIYTYIYICTYIYTHILDIT
jgi:hypothetical protein